MDVTKIMNEARERAKRENSLKENICPECGETLKQITYIEISKYDLFVTIECSCGWSSDATIPLVYFNI